MSVFLQDVLATKCYNNNNNNLTCKAPVCAKKDFSGAKRLQWRLLNTSKANN